MQQPVRGKCLNIKNRTYTVMAKEDLAWFCPSTCRGVLQELVAIRGMRGYTQLTGAFQAG
jgi:hypothetical protein